MECHPTRLEEGGSRCLSVGRMVATRDLKLIDHLIAKTRDPELEPPREEPDIDTGVELFQDALRAYRKRVQLTRLDHESKPARSPLSSGRTRISMPSFHPNQYPPEVWQALARRGGLESTDQGLDKIPLQRRDC